jgi:flagellar motor switch protein FliN/FliY
VDHPEKGNNAIEIVNDVTIQITAELGSTQMRLEDIMKLKIGDVISLEKAAGDPADVYVSDLNIAKAEITVVDDHLGLRILAMDNLENRIKY